ncbi:hypothetical protein AA13595_1285 [Gluconacetobacter johannae DSM 13595]|uniref:Redoxin domain-containing protein n=1 Tax=Gluconacetobacter johannae TaxID=112140 RepID=A0A7W4J8T0_9PROT|nr:redoxin domain-containing protein [Gluconacetobacter johannae]MBB2176806.1 redoxin domain-containing protein [Gluconacetobacter johannae]GBQ83931.1 hypothetical protein AA13595_1285 [Gluconacetobacter johannae DSM 13595]
MSSARPLFVGDPAPWFTQRCTTPFGTYSFDMAAGRYIVLFFFASSTEPAVAAALEAVMRDRALMDGTNCHFFGVSTDPADEARLHEALPGIRFFRDDDRKVTDLYGLSAGDAPRWFILDPMLRISATWIDAPGVARQVMDLLRRLPPVTTRSPNIPVPALMLPDVFEPEFCQQLIAYYTAQDTRQSGIFTEQQPGQSVSVTDLGFKRRRDCTLADRTLVGQVQARIIRRVAPEIHKVFQFNATRMERLILACYDSSDRGCFGAHRDNTVAAAAHRRFAVSITLNDDFEGGELSFPEFGGPGFCPPAGGALIFSCGLLHAVAPVTRGRRFACLPFVYDDAAAELKKANRAAATRIETV